MKPTRPTARLVPPVAHRATIGRHREHVEVLWKTCDHTDWRAVTSWERGERTDAIPDHLTADSAKWYVERAHLAVVFGPETTTVIVVRPFEQSDCAGRNRTWPIIHLTAIRIAHCRDCCGGRHRPSPLQCVAVGIGSNVGFGRLARRMVIMTRLIAAGVKRVFVGEAEGSVPHLMDGDLGCTVRPTNRCRQIHRCLRRLSS